MEDPEPRPGSAGGFGSPQPDAEAHLETMAAPSLPTLIAEAPSPVAEDNLSAPPTAAAPVSSQISAVVPVPASGPATAAAPQPAVATGSNVVAAIRSFLPVKRPASPQVAAGKKQVKVRKLSSRHSDALGRWAERAAG